ncbi:acyl carrier protein [Candidatus Magnetaquicoccus inordinatus]|uniref:acyl carrier protein n=1 Tax=Candidatus Magnetaquicoccus inordinatus TaxID=2496818 RepID=UPI00102CE59E|nr:acyl carrier protein [Candidatus Magnetaquicoccus inordinatus]
MTKDEIFVQLQDFLQELFEIPREHITLESRLYEDLDLDSIDAVDLVVKLQKLTGRRFKPESFKSVSTVQDVVQVTWELLQESGNVA